MTDQRAELADLRAEQHIDAEMVDCASMRGSDPIMTREPLDWEKNPQSSGLTFEGSGDRLRFAASTPKSNRRPQPQITTGFKVMLWVGAIGVVVGTILLSLR